jgi:NADH-quinone oxidoreductase subunit C
VNSTDLLDGLRLLFPGTALDAAPSTDQKTIGVPANSLLDVCRALRDRSGFTFLADITAVDWWPKEPRFEVIYHLATANDRLRLSVRLEGASAHLDTVQAIWPAAGWLEREVWDLFGIVFDGHGDLRRLLMPEDWEGHPLRKDFPVQIRLKPRTGEPLQVSEDEFRRNLNADRAARSGAALHDSPSQGRAE